MARKSFHWKRLDWLAATGCVAVAGSLAIGASGGGMPEPVVFAVDTAVNHLVSVDPATGAVNQIGPISIGPGFIIDMAAAQGRLYVLASEYPTLTRLVELDPASGAVLSDSVLTVDGQIAPNAIEAIAGLADGTVLVSLWRPGAPNIASSSSIGRVSADGAVTGIVNFGDGADFDGLATDERDALVSLDREPGIGFDFIRLNTVSYPAGSFSQIVHIPFSPVINYVDDPVVYGNEILTFDRDTKRINHHDRATGNITSWVTYPSQHQIYAAAAVLWLPAACPWDLDSDGVVGGADLGALLAEWGSADADADFNGDGTVDGADLGALLAAWGACP